MLTSTVCVALSAAGLAIALLTAYRRRFRRATMIAAAALLPVGLYMTGLVSLAGTVVRAVADWAMRPGVQAVGVGGLRRARPGGRAVRPRAGRRAPQGGP